jgi:diguanylate cyclase (GGDEF)-like protein
MVYRMKRIISLLMLLVLISGAVPLYAATSAIDDLHKEAQKDYREGRLADAVSKMERVVQQDPSFLPGWNDLGCCFLAQRNYEKANVCFKQAQTLAPNDPQVLFNLGNSYLFLNNMQDAKSIFQKILDQNPSFAKARAQLSIVYLKEKNFDAAASEAQKLIDQEPENLQYNKLLIQIYMQKGDNAKVKECCSRALALSPGDPELKTLMSTLDNKTSPLNYGTAPSPEQTGTKDKKTNLLPIIVAVVLAAIIIGLLLSLVMKKLTALPFPESIPLRSGVDGASVEEDDDFDTDRVRKDDDETGKKEPPPSEVSQCLELHDCQPEIRESCAAFLENSNCWSYEKTPCCEKDRALCVLCQYYTIWLKKAQKSTSPQVRELVIKESDSSLMESLSNPQMTFLRELSTAISSTNDVPELGKIFLEKTSDNIISERSALFMVSSEKDSLSLLASTNWSDESLEARSMHFSPYMYQWIAENKFPMSLQQARKDKNWAKFFSTNDEKALVEAFEIVHPLLEEKNKMLGLVFFGKKRTDAAYQPEDLNLIILACGMISMSLDKAKAYKLADFDDLTNLSVVRSFREKLKEELKVPKSLLQGCSIVMIDIDHFKDFNDTYGHQQGDMVLKEVARLIQGNLRSGDMAARYGGEELAVIFPVTDKSVAFDMAERIRTIVMNYRFNGLPEDVGVTISLGVASYPQDAQLPEELIGKADQALYRAKKSGRNKTCLASG